MKYLSHVFISIIMSSGFVIKLLSYISVCLLVISSAEKMCSSKTFSSNRVFKSCNDLPNLKAHLHWNYIPSTGKVSIAYRATQKSQKGWIAWAINPTAKGMVGSQALVAVMRANSSIKAYTTSIDNYNPSMLHTKLSFHVSNISAEYSNNEMTIFAEIGPLKTGPVVNHVWQSGTSVLKNVPQRHSISPPHLQSMGTIDFSSS